MDILRWTPAEVGDRLIDCIVSFSAYSKERFQYATALASYSAIKPTMTSLETIHDALEDIGRAIAPYTGYEGEYLQGIHQALVCALRIAQGDQLSYVERVKALQQLECQMIPEHNILQLREKVSKALGDMGYQGDCGAKVQQWMQETVIAPDEVTKVAREYIDQAKHDTLKRVIELPEDDRIDEIKGVTGVFWSGFSLYNGDHCGTLHFNLDRPWSVPTFVNILCHEGYPGHQAFYCRWDQLYQQGKWPLEASYYAYNTPTNALFEGGPELGLHALGWDDPTVETAGISMEMKKVFALGRDIIDLQRMYQTNACFMANIHQANQQECVQYMLSSGIFAEVEALNAYRFFTDPIKSTYYPGYYYGRWFILKAYELFAPDRRKDFFRILYDTPHTTDTFIQAIREASGEDFVPFVGL